MLCNVVTHFQVTAPDRQFKLIMINHFGQTHLNASTQGHKTTPHREKHGGKSNGTTSTALSSKSFYTIPYDTSSPLTTLRIWHVN